MASIVVSGVVYEVLESRSNPEEFDPYVPAHSLSSETRAVRHAVYLSAAAFTGAGEFSPTTHFGRLFKLVSYSRPE